MNFPARELHASVTIKASCPKLLEVLSSLNDLHRQLFRTISFGQWLEIPHRKGDALLIRGLFLHQLGNGCGRTTIL